MSSRKTNTVSTKKNGMVKLTQLRVPLEMKKFVGDEPEWYDVQIADGERQSVLATTINWYSYFFGSKEATQLICDYLQVNGRGDASKKFQRVPDYTYPCGVAWLARMSLRGWCLSDDESRLISDTVGNCLALLDNKNDKKHTTAEPNKPNIQDRMLEKAQHLGGELEYMMDQYIADGAKAKHEFSPIDLMKEVNVLPQHVSRLVEHWEAVLREYVSVKNGTDKQLMEGYGNFNKTQIKNIIKFCERVIADFHSYVTYKKVTKAPRARKPKTPAQLVSKLKYMKKSPENGLESVSATKIIGCKEMYVYSIAKRKLQRYVADPAAGNALSVKNNTIIGFDTTKSVAKTLRKPKEQLDEFMKATRPASRRQFAHINAVEVKLSGRFSDDLVILKVW